MALPQIVKLFYRSDFTVELPLAEGYNNQEFKFTLYTCGEIENGFIASYIDNVYTNCSVENNIVIIYVDNNNKMNTGCLTVQSEYDYSNHHFLDNEDNIKDTYKTNIYLVDYQTNSFSAAFRPSNLPDLSNTTDFVTWPQIEEELTYYVTFTYLTSYNYITEEYLNNSLSGYATEAYVAEYVSQYAPEYDMTAYVTHDELNQASYAPRTLLMFKQDTLVSGENIKTINNESILGSGNLNVVTDLTGYATESYVADYVSSHSGDIDMSAYVSKNDLNEMGYLNNQAVQNILSNASYITSTELSSIGYITYQYLEDNLYKASYITQSQLSSNSYATQTYVADYVAEHAGPTPDLSAYVTKDELNNASYATQSYVTNYVATYAPMPDLSAYITQDELSQMGYITNSSLPDMSSYVTKEALEAASYVNHTELNSASYATQTYVANYVSEHAGPVDLTAYVTHEELNNAGYITMGDVSACGYISSIPSNYITEDELDNMAYATESYVANYVSEHAGPTPDLSAYVTKDELNQAGYLTSIPSNYITEDELDNMAYATQSYVTNYVATYAPTPDLSAYVTHTDLDNASYVSHTELNNAGYATSIDLQLATKRNLVPFENDTYSLGSYEYQYKNVYTYNLYNKTAYTDSIYLNGVDILQYVNNGSIFELTQYEYDLLSYEEKNNGYLYIITDSNSASLTDYVSKSDLNNAAYATQSYVANYVATYAPTPDLSSYVTKDELDNAGYLTSIPSDYATYDAISQMGYITAIPSEYVTETELSGMSYATQSYVNQQIASIPSVDLSSYVTKDELDNAGYLTSIPSDYATYEAISQMGYITAIPSEYITETELSGMSYVTHTDLNNASYASVYTLTQSQYDIAYQGGTLDPNTLYIISDAEVADLSEYATKAYVESYYVTKDELNQAGYISSIPSDYATYEAISQMGYITAIPSEYVTESELSGMSYATQSYVADYVATYGGGGSTVIDENIIPNTTNTYTLGDASHLYAATYTEELKLGGASMGHDGNNAVFKVNGVSKYLFAATQIIPYGSENDKQLNLGASNRQWAVTYTDNLHIDTAATLAYSDNTIISYNAANVLGNQNVPMQISAKTSNIFKINGTNKACVDSSSVRPWADGGTNLGRSDRQWGVTYTQQLYINSYQALSTYNLIYDSNTNTLTIVI